MTIVNKKCCDDYGKAHYDGEGSSGQGDSGSSGHHAQWPSTKVSTVEQRVWCTGKMICISTTLPVFFFIISVIVS